MARDWSEEYLRDNTCVYKKHEDETWYEIVQRDRDYVQWLLENIEQMDPDLREALTWGVDNVPDRI